jgi:uncharacterized membrane protein (DUF2068 family)
MSSLRRLRFIAITEVVKGIVTLLGVGSITWLSHRQPHQIEAFFDSLPLNPDGTLVRFAVSSLDRVQDIPLWLIASLLLAYCTMRFGEAWGLWWNRLWASWLGALSGAIYIPFEIADLVRKPTLWIWLVLIFNLAVVGILAANVVRTRRREAAPEPPPM